ncbi:MAG TPA: DUF1801 domain-containing protein [Candidatus Dormibacteraeota bacterium]|nr:DUF1801 domain-containing protein [Candidatus Dormibacteraeota bacterium]
MAADASRRIDQHIKSLGDWRGEMMARLRRIIISTEPSLTEELKWGTPVFISNGNVVAIGALKEGVKINFFKGASLADPHHLFNGGLDAKTSRSIDLKKGDRVNEPALKELVRAAVAKNGGKR